MRSAAQAGNIPARPGRANGSAGIIPAHSIWQVSSIRLLRRVWTHNKTPSGPSLCPTTLLPSFFSAQQHIVSAQPSYLTPLHSLHTSHSHTLTGPTARSSCSTTHIIVALLLLLSHNYTTVPPTRKGFIPQAVFPFRCYYAPGALQPHKSSTTHSYTAHRNITPVL